MLATNGVRYATAYDREILDLFTAIRHHTELDHAGRLLSLNSQRHLRPAREMAALFRDVPEPSRTQSISRRGCKFELNDLGYEFPRYPVPDGETMDSFLRKRVAEGVQRRYGPKNDPGLLERAKKQVEHELASDREAWLCRIFPHRLGHRPVLQAKRHPDSGARQCGELRRLLCAGNYGHRSGRNGAALRALPEREPRRMAGHRPRSALGRQARAGHPVCLSAVWRTGRGDDRQRHHLSRQVGGARSGQSTGLRSGIAGAAFEPVSNWEWRGKNDTMAHSFQHAGFDIKHPRIAKYLELCMRIQDLPRHLGQHSGGMVICQGQLNQVVPLERASMPGRTVVQWDKEDCADLGIIKVDLLGLGMMAVLKDCLELIPEHYGDRVDLAQLPEDEEVYKRLQQADTVGMFQVESRAQMASLPRNQPEKFYDLVVQVAIIRPGPIVGQMMHPYMRRRQGKEEVTYPHPSLEAGIEAHSGRAALSGTTAAHGDDGRQLLRRGGRRAAPCRGDAPLLGAHEESRSQTPRGHDGERHRHEDAGQHRAEHQFVCALWFS